jgi:Predicted DNA-binding protein with the Helix-hairpin-helix motif
MANIILPKIVTYEDQLRMMAEDAQFDVSDSKESEHMCVPDLSVFSDIKAKPNAPKVPKMFVASKCIFNCAYCGCRASKDRDGYCNDPKRLAEMCVAEAVKNGHGVFLSSAIYKNADYTEELIIQTIKHMRQDFGYRGYIHAKIMPGADPLLIREAGLYADRLSVNIEVAKKEGYDRIAHQKNKVNILGPMQTISDLILEAKETKGPYLKGKFAHSQTTQMMAGAVSEDDRTIMNLSSALYRKYHLSRVYYTGFHYTYTSKGYDDIGTFRTPAWRVRRLYQADRLMQLYGFSHDEITPDSEPNLAAEIDPKISWALRNISIYPVEVNTADYDTLLRIPGIGIVFAKKIIRARKYCTVTHEVLRKIGVSLKRSIYFIKCNGKYVGTTTFLDSPEMIRETFSDGTGQNGEQLMFDIGF